MNDVTNRFIELYSELKKAKIITGQADFAQKIGISPSTFTEIRKGRSNAGLNVIQGTVSKFTNINPVWLLTGKGKMYVNYVSTPDVNKGEYDLNEPHSEYSPNATSQNVSPKHPKSVSPTVSPTPKLELPKVVTVDKSGNDNIVMVPVAARAGYLMGYGDIEYIKELPTYHVPRLQNGTFRAFEVDGHSMTPTITHGDIVFAEWVEKFEHITDDRVYVIITKTDGIVIKRVLNRVEQYGFLVAKSDSITNKRQYPNLNIPPSDIVELWQAKMYLGADFSSPHSMWDRLNDLEAALEALKSEKGS